LIQIMKASRVLYGMARLGTLPAALGRVHGRTRTPVVATALSTLVAALFALALPIAALAETTTVITLTTFALANFALLLVKRRTPEAAGATTFPAWIPALGFVFSSAFVVLEAVQRIG
jgi:amino acid transporter